MSTTYDHWDVHEILDTTIKAREFLRQLNPESQSLALQDIAEFFDLLMRMRRFPIETITEFETEVENLAFFISFLVDDIPSLRVYWTHFSFLILKNEFGTVLISSIKRRRLKPNYYRIGV